MPLIKRVCLWSAFKIGTDVRASVLWFTFRQSPIVSVAHLPVLAHLSKQAAGTWPWKHESAPEPSQLLYPYSSAVPQIPRKKTSKSDNRCRRCHPLASELSVFCYQWRHLQPKAVFSQAGAPNSWFREKVTKCTGDLTFSPETKHTHTRIQRGPGTTGWRCERGNNNTTSEPAPKTRARILGTESQPPADGWRLCGLISWYFS